MPAAAHFPDPHRWSAADPDVDGLEPSPEWAGEAIAAERFGSPEAIRAALLPEQGGEFDAAFDAALTAARQTLRLDQLRHVLRIWRRMALMTGQDLDGHRQMLVIVAEVQRTGRPRPGSVPWSELTTGARSLTIPVPQVRTGFPHVVPARLRPCGARPDPGHCHRRESTRSPRS